MQFAGYDCSGCNNQIYKYVLLGEDFLNICWVEFFFRQWKSTWLKTTMLVVGFCFFVFFVYRPWLYVRQANVSKSRAAEEVVISRRDMNPYIYICEYVRCVYSFLLA